MWADLTWKISVISKVEAPHPHWQFGTAGMSLEVIIQTASISRKSQLCSYY
jgi:hypothetical protein